MFRQALIRLTAWYLGVIVIISLIFSFSLYETSVHEINNGLRPPGPALIINNPFQDDGRIGQTYDQFREARLEESESKIINNLVYFNIWILLIGGIASYLLAKLTLEPIERAHISQSRFTSDASHELRTPLSVMRSEIEVALRDDKLPEKEARALLQSNLEEIDKLTLLSDSLLKLAREQKIGPISTNEVSLEEIAKNAIKGLSTKAKAKKLSFVNELNNIKVRGDQSMLTEVITILLDNAIKYSPEGKSIDIKISESREHARVIITDHGIGISEVDLPHIFDRFYRADISRSGTDGHGLGLSIAKQIAELHLGNIEITSKQDQGTIAALVLPKI